MPDIRINPITGDAVIVSTSRAERPGAWSHAKQDNDRPCPFCPGNERETPPEIEGTGNDLWAYRVVPNKYPAIATGGRVPYHEVVIDCPEHDLEFENIGHRRLGAAVELWRRRAIAQSNEPDRRYVAVFRNEGRGAGQSISHPHSQILALDRVPLRVSREMAGFLALDCPLCILSKSEISSGECLIDCAGELILMAAPAGRVPFEMWVVSRSHEPGWTSCVPQDLARLLTSAVRRLRFIHPQAPFNLGLITAPLRTEGADNFHWYAELTPRLTNFAGFELSTGESINIESPENAAKLLREARIVSQD